MDQDYFAEELEEIIFRNIPTSFGRLHSIVAGTIGQPLILVVHGSGPKNNCELYRQLLQEYLVRVSYLQRFYMVAIDCPGYGKSEGSKEAVKTFPLRLFKDILKSLGYQKYFSMYGHSQGGAAIFNAVYEDPSITQNMVMDRPVCGNIQRFRKFQTPTLLVYDVEDDGHPIWQGKLLYKQLANSQFHSYRSSMRPYFVHDQIWNLMLDFYTKKPSQRLNRLNGVMNSRRIRSQDIFISPLARTTNGYQNETQARHAVSVGKEQQARHKLEHRQMSLEQIQQIQQSEKHTLIDEPICNFDEIRPFQNIQHIEVPYFQSQGSSSEREQQFQPKFTYQAYKVQEQDPKTNIETEIKGNQQIKKQKQEMIIQEVKVQQQKKANEQIISQVPLQCSICYDYFYHPMTTNCKHTFCFKCLTQCLLVDERCPLCRAKVTQKISNPQLHELIVPKFSETQLLKRQSEQKRLKQMLLSIVKIEVGNRSRELPTKQAFVKRKKKYVWEVYVQQPKNFKFEEVLFNINMGNEQSKPVKVRSNPFSFQSRGTFSFSCEITIKPMRKQYKNLVVIYRINVEPGHHRKIVAMTKKCYN